jgi:hypothetical protein
MPELLLALRHATAGLSEIFQISRGLTLTVKEVTAGFCWAELRHYERFDYGTLASNALHPQPQHSRHCTSTVQR